MASISICVEQKISKRMTNSKQCAYSVFSEIKKWDYLVTKYMTSKKNMFECHAEHNSVFREAKIVLI